MSENIGNVLEMFDIRRDQQEIVSQGGGGNLSVNISDRNSAPTQMSMNASVKMGAVDIEIQDR